MRVALFCIILIISGCNNSNQKHASSDETAIIWVNSFKADCHHQGQILSCLQIQEGELLQEDKWETYFSVINDFDYVPGNLYKLKVSVQEPTPSKSVGAPNVVHYTLIEEIERKVDYKLRLNDLWSLEVLNGEAVPNDITKVPFLEIHFVDMTIMGNGSCNNFSGTIESLSNESIKFGNIASTKMACRDLAIEGEFFQALEQVEFYQIESLNLVLLDANKEVLLSFKKVD
ncbi:MAG: META domain-containing protein [Chitinophagales bacterium]